jgi:hypothetical protein
MSEHVEAFAGTINLAHRMWVLLGNTLPFSAMIPHCSSPGNSRLSIRQPLLRGVLMQADRRRLRGRRAWRRWVDVVAMGLGVAGREDGSSQLVVRY